MEITVTNIPTLSVISTPRMLIPTNRVYETSHHSQRGTSGMRVFRYPPIPTTITAGVRTYSIVSVMPTIKPPPGPKALLVNE